MQEYVCFSVCIDVLCTVFGYRKGYVQIQLHIFVNFMRMCVQVYIREESVSSEV